MKNSNTNILNAAATQINLLKQKDENAISALYVEQKNGFLSFIKKYGVEDDVAVDIYQDAVVALVENAVKGKIDDLKTSVSTYLFAIGKYMAYNRYKLSKRTDINTEAIPENFVYETYETNDEKLTVIQTHLEKLGEKCREILRLFYYEEKKTDDIMRLMGYDNKDVFKSQKSRCLSQLKTMVNSK